MNRWIRFRTWAAKTIYGTFRFLGPVARPVRNKLSNQEVQRVLIKAFTAGSVGTAMTWKALTDSILTNKELIEVVAIPLAFAVITGFFEAMDMLQQGDHHGTVPSGPQLPVRDDVVRPDDVDVHVDGGEVAGGVAGPGPGLG